MWEDEIVEEVRRVREELAARFNYDIKAIVENARKEQGEPRRKMVSFPPRKPDSNRGQKPVAGKA